MSNQSQRIENEQQEESFASKLFRTILVGAGIGIGAYVGYQVISLN